MKLWTSPNISLNLTRNLWPYGYNYWLVIIVVIVIHPMANTFCHLNENMSSLNIIFIQSSTFIRGSQKVSLLRHIISEGSTYVRDSIKTPQTTCLINLPSDQPLCTKKHKNGNMYFNRTHISQMHSLLFCIPQWPSCSFSADTIIVSKLIIPQIPHCTVRKYVSKY